MGTACSLTLPKAQVGLVISPRQPEESGISALGQPQERAGPDQGWGVPAAQSSCPGKTPSLVCAQGLPFAGPSLLKMLLPRGPVQDGG